MSGLYGIAMFVAGAGLAIAGTERLLKGLVGVSGLVRRSTFTVAVVLSGLEAENIAVGLAGGARGSAAVALGSVYGGSIFLLCAAVGVGAVISPIRFRLPPLAAGVMVAAAAASGLPLLSSARTLRPLGVVLLVLFVAAMWATVRAARTIDFEPGGEVAKEWGRPHSWWWAVGSSAAGLVVLAGGGELVSAGALRVVHHYAVPAALVGAVIAPAAVELEEIARQVVPARHGHPEVSAANVVGTLVYFTLANLGLITLFTPVHVDRLTRVLDWPFLVGVSIVVAVFLARGRLGRLEGALLVVLYAGFVVAHIVVRT